MSKLLGNLSAFSRSVLPHGNVRVLAVASMLTGTYVSMLNATLQQFTSLALGVAGLGLLQALGNRIGGLSGSLIQPFAGRLSDSYGRRVVVMAGSLVSISSMTAFLAAAVTRIPLLLVPGYVFFGLSLLGSPASQALIAESVDMEPKKMAVAFSTVFFFNSVPGVVTALAAGLIADLLGYYVIFALAIVLESANLMLYLTSLKETMGTSQRISLRLSIRSLKELITPPKGFGAFFATFAVDAFSFSITGWIIYGMIVKEFSYSNTDIGIIVGALSAGLVLTQYPATRFLLRFGPRISLAFAELMSIITLLLWEFAKTLPYFVLASIFLSVSSTAWLPALQSMLMRLAPPEERGSMGGRLAAFRGIIAFPAPIIGGILYERFGYYIPIAVTIAGIALATIMIVRLLPDDQGGRVTNANGHDTEIVRSEWSKPHAVKHERLPPPQATGSG
jgi:MFS family permease